MTNRGTTTVLLNPHAIGKGIHGNVVPNLGEDYGTEVRAAAVARSRQERLQRAYDQQDAAFRAAERQKILDIAQQTYDKAHKSQVNILVSGQNQLRRLLFTGGIFAAVAVAAVTVSSVLSKPNSSSRRKRSSRRSRRSARRTSSPSPFAGVAA